LWNAAQLFSVRVDVGVDHDVRELVVVDLPEVEQTLQDAGHGDGSSSAGGVRRRLTVATSAPPGLRTTVAGTSSPLEPRLSEPE
jgi:hypothetical protein